MNGFREGVGCLFNIRTTKQILPMPLVIMETKGKKKKKERKTKRAKKIRSLAPKGDYNEDVLIST